MKQRIISGVIMGAIVATVLVFGLNVDSVIITIFLAAVAAIATSSRPPKASRSQPTSRRSAKNWKDERILWKTKR